MAAPQVITLGCRLNAFESEMIREQGRAAGLKDAVIINTCAVTAEAERQARQTIRRARRDNPKARLIVTGCAAQLDPAKFGAMPEVDGVLGNTEKMDLGRFVTGADAEAAIHVTDIMQARDTAPHLIHGFDGRARAFVEVQQGCDHRCTFCIIPFARGPNRAVGVGRVVDQVRLLVGEGFKEVVLTGVDICSYGAGLPGDVHLGDLVRRLLENVPELPRLRLSSLDPAAMDDALFEVLADEPRLMPHLHLSVQSLDDTILKRMKRRHLRADVAAVMARARAARPDVVFGADLIAGFPTETAAQARTTRAAARDLGLTHLHVFPYSERPGTPAARMPAVPVAERKDRAQALRALGDDQLRRFMETRVGERADVLVENDAAGLSEHYVPVRLEGDVRAGELMTVRLTGLAEGRLSGVPIP
ncbi:MAG: tRNA (N(6)-L-threonylcarbamoyladenosine(37)-C(2))-methylthiotransferase MtaB [Magnetovibrio sp.]|nr:tRNA (N(6)-L-threonylcarbamoyladenosine(37)-C(2))-methylthiotransferase MtaB [Magnetovibrio sp.]